MDIKDYHALFETPQNHLWILSDKELERKLCDIVDAVTIYSKQESRLSFKHDVIYNLMKNNGILDLEKDPPTHIDIILKQCVKRIPVKTLKKQYKATVFAIEINAEAMENIIKQEDILLAELSLRL